MLFSINWVNPLHSISNNNNTKYLQHILYIISTIHKNTALKSPQSSRLNTESGISELGQWKDFSLIVRLQKTRNTAQIIQTTFNHFGVWHHTSQMTSKSTQYIFFLHFFFASHKNNNSLRVWTDMKVNKRRPNCHFSAELSFNQSQYQS